MNIHTKKEQESFKKTFSQSGLCWQMNLQQTQGELCSSIKFHNRKRGASVFLNVVFRFLFALLFPVFVLFALLFASVEKGSGCRKRKCEGRAVTPSISSGVTIKKSFIQGGKVFLHDKRVHPLFEQESSSVLLDVKGGQQFPRLRLLDASGLCENVTLNLCSPGSPVNGDAHYSAEGAMT